MTPIKYFRYFLLIAFLPLMSCQVRAQSIDENLYLHKMQLLDSLSIYKMQDYDTLSHITVLRNFRGADYKYDDYGWITKRSETGISLININGKKLEIEKKAITGITALPLNETTIDTLLIREREDMEFYKCNFASNYPLVLWLYKKGQPTYSKRLLPQKEDRLCDTCLRDDFGILYYNAMLEAFSTERNYPEAIAFCQHLSHSVFKGYEYQNVAIKLAGQLKSETQDFKSFCLPDSLEWSVLKQKLNRNDQILYLTDRLRLLNCIQPGQPGGIDYAMYQYSISYMEANKIGISYWEHSTKYGVINPFSELLQMNLNLHEVKLLLPYLLTDTYISSYNYHRDFFRERNLHKLSWVVESLIFGITNNGFFNRLNFDTLTLDQKKAEVAKIKNWCDENAGLSKEALILKTLRTTNKWGDFYAALQVAKEAKYDSMLNIIVQRFHDFKGGFWPSYSGTMAKTMFEVGNEKFIGTVKGWSRDTSDKWVNLWSALYLIKYDKGSYDAMMNRLGAILQECDGTSYYPHAMDLLLKMNDPRALKLAEGILSKTGFQQMMFWDNNMNFIKQLLALKSDYTFNFFYSKLKAYTPEEMERVHKDEDHVMAPEDNYVLVIDELKNGTTAYLEEQTNTARLKYIDLLRKWFKTQYDLLKKDKPNELRLNIKQGQEPVTFVDSYHQ